MKEVKKEHKYLFLGLIVVFGILTIYAIRSSETPRLVLFLGRFHPLLLHLPIGALVVTFFIDILGRFQKSYNLKTVSNLLGFTAFFAIATCFLGYFLSLEGGYQDDTLDLHFYTGIGTAFLTVGLFLLSLKPEFNNNKMFLLLFIVTLISISIAGHYGSVLTHGENFLTEYASAPKKERTIEVIDSLKLYSDVVQKILDNKCIECHNATKQKGNLSLISPEFILKGGEHGASIIDGIASKSSLYTRLVLPISNDEHMPPEGKEQLTKDEIWLIEHWINQGANFENYAQNITTNSILAKKLKKYLVFNTIKIPKASTSAIEDVTKAGFRVIEIVPNQAELSVKYLNKEPSKASIDKLSQLKEQIVELDFHKSKITGDMITVIKKLKNLKTLKINSPLITDEALENFNSLENLKVLNLYNTSITNTGLAKVLQYVKPEKIYVWNTKVDKSTAIKLEQDYQISIENNINDGFVAESKLELPLISPIKTLFTDTIHIGLKSRLKNVSLYYTLDGKEPDTSSAIYNNRIVLNNSRTLKVKAFKANWLPSDVLVKEYAKINTRVASFNMKNPPDERYPNPNKLFDLKEGTLTFSDGNWVGYYGNDLETTIDLESIKTVNNISIRCLEDVASWILYPTDFIVYASKTKNGTFKKVAAVKISRNGEGGDSEAKKITAVIPNTSGRYFKLKIKNHKVLPKWHPSAGNPSWLFIDEIYFW